MQLGSQSPVFCIFESCVDPRRPRVFAEQDEGVGMGVGLCFVGAESRCYVGGLFVYGVPVPHSPPYHRLVVHPVFDKTCGVEAALMAHFHGAEVGRHVVLEAGRSPNNRGVVHYAAYLRAARPPRPPLRPPSPPPASSPSLCSRGRFFTDGRDGSVCLDEGVLTWSLKVPQVMGRWFDERRFARVAELFKDIGDVWDDEAARGGP